MFDFVRRHNRLLQFGLVVVIFPSFVAFGIQGYQSFDARTHSVAKVDGQPITQTEWDAAHRQQAERMRANNPAMDTKLLDSPVIRQRVLEDMVRERVLLAAMRDLRLEPTDQRLQRLFQADPQFAPLRNPDGSVRKELLEARGMSSAQFASQLRFELGLRQVMLGLGASVPATAAVAARATEPYFQQREIRVVNFSPREQAARIKIEDADLKAFYEDPRNATRFQAPEQAAVDYLVLDMAAAMREVRVDEAELRKYYDENIVRFEQPQERRARHILVKVDTSADDKARAAAKAKAEALLARLKADRAAFADIARKESNDPGSAAQGGDLDWIQRGAMVKPFEDAVFAMKKGDLSGLVQTEFGWHLIEVTDARGGERKPFEAVRGELDAEYRKQQAGKRFAELAEQFADQVEQEDQLKPVADKLKLELRSVAKVVRGVSAGLPPELAHPKVQEVLFDAQTVAGKRNSDPIDIGTNQLLSLHVRSHVPAHRMSVEELGDRLHAWTLEAKASAAAVDAGKAALAQWRERGDALAQGKSVVVSRVGAAEQPRELIDAVLRAPSDKLPAWVGVDLGAKGYAVARIDKVIAPDAAVIDPKAAAGQYAQLWTQAENDAYYQALRKRYKVEINAPAPTASTP